MRPRFFGWLLMSCCGDNDDCCCNDCEAIAVVADFVGVEALEWVLLLMLSRDDSDSVPVLCASWLC